ncbi:T9SS type A sorting domain-containing protein [Hymenobacter terrestris]|uniref:T9SS type A sorting domain-containing protein n=1 Tax=Hymenobacter terrestris TaxID=2748310 RepID=A0ABX2Q4J0_9BACT|nr:T9SS type A sorting domain-containing protein [Hymenobacter terrestris]NVO85885.1 T9SS type A sorting domain-containing protein [Hymenobacter terrestris]
MSTAFPALAHKEWVHQYLVRQAYQYLENSIGPIPVLSRGVGMTYGNNFFPGEDYRPFNTGVPIAIGAWREDLEDVVYQYKPYRFDWEQIAVNDATTSITHFWRADSGDDDRLDLGLVNGKTYENAWMKARVLLFCELQPYVIQIPWQTRDGAVRKYGIRYTSLPELYKGNFYLEYIETANGRTFMGQQKVGDIAFADGFAQPVALQLLGRVAHLLGDMGVPAHAHNHLHPCQVGKPDKFENHVGNTYYTNNNGSDCEKYPGSNNLPVYRWTAATAAAQGSLINDIYCTSSAREKLRYLFYTQNQIADFFPSGVNDNSLEGGSQNKEPGNNNALTNQHISAVYNRFGSVSPSYISFEDIGDASFNFGIRATATLFQWFAFEAGIISDLNNNRLLTTSNDNKYLLCDGGSATDMRFTHSPPLTTPTFVTEPAGAATFAETSPGNYRLTPSFDGYNGLVVVTAKYTSYYGCETRQVALKREFWKGRPITAIQTMEEANGDNTYRELEPYTTMHLTATTVKSELQGNLQYSWTHDNFNFHLDAAGANASLGASEEYNDFVRVNVVVNNGCGPTSTDRAFATRYQSPDETCIICPGFQAGDPSSMDNLTTSETSKLKDKLHADGVSSTSLFPNPSNNGFTIVMGRKGKAVDATSLTPFYVLLDTFGRQVGSGNIPSNRTFINTGLLANGVYVLKIINSDHTEYKKVQVLH